MSTRIVHTVVFADGPGGGNPCPVVFDADGLSTEEMQARAAAFGHETAFVLEPRDGGDIRLRYFVPRHEMEMCVHATVACARLTMARSVETPLGVRAVEHDGEIAMVEQFAPELGEWVEDTGELLRALGVSEAGPVRSVSDRPPQAARPARRRGDAGRADARLPAPVGGVPPARHDRRLRLHDRRP